MGIPVSIRPSALGAKGLLLFAAMQFAFLATNYSNLFFLTLSFSAVLGGLGAFWAYRNLSGLQITGIEVGAAGAGTVRTIQVQIDGATRSRFDLTIQLRIHKKPQPIGYAPSINGRASVRDSMPGQPRSLQTVEYVRVVSRYPFGFFVAHTKLPARCELVTHPAPVQLGFERNQDSSANDGMLLTAGRGSSLAGLRGFRTGDMMSDIHWKATARRGKAVVKERERESEQGVDVVLDRRCDGEMFEHALSQLTTLVFAARHGAPLRIYSQDVELLVDLERGGAQDALRWLASTTPLPLDASAPPHKRGAMQFPEPSRTTP